MSAKTSGRIVGLDRRASLVTGIALLVMSVIAGFGNFGAIEALVTPGDAGHTDADIDASETLYTFVGEFALAAWLVARAGRTTTTSVITVGDAPSPRPLVASGSFPTPVVIRSPQAQRLADGLAGHDA